MTRHNDIPWDAASCASVAGGNMWFPLPKQTTLIAKLTKICDSCPIKTMCHDYAVEHDLVGFWGGKLFSPTWEMGVWATTPTSQTVEYQAKRAARVGMRAMYDRPRGRPSGKHDPGVQPSSDGGGVSDVRGRTA